VLYDQYFIDVLKDRADLVLRVWFILVGLVSVTPAQESPKAVLVDELANSLCSDELRGRIDNYFMEISQRPNSVGYVIGNADSAIPGRFERYFKLFHSHARLRRFDVNRIRLYRGPNGSSMAFQLWVVPPGARPPKFPMEFHQQKFVNTTLFDASRIHSIRKGKIEFGEYTESAEPCDFGIGLSNFAAAVRSDPNLRAYLLVTSGGRRRKAWALGALETARQILSKEYGIKANRIKRIYAGRRSEPVMQLWLVPNGLTTPTFRENSIP